MRILITGAAGFFGRHFLRELENTDHHVVGIDIKQGSLGVIRHDARNLADGEHWDLVIHLAAFVGGRVGIDNDPLHVAENLGIDSSVFAWCARNKPGRLVYFSSAASYPLTRQTKTDYMPLKEDYIDLDYIEWPDSLYGWAKVTGEQMTRYLRDEGVPVTVVRPFSCYSVEQEEKEYPFPAFIGRAMRKENPFQIWGDGTQVRDWTHGEDAVKAIMQLVSHKVDGPVNLATGRPTDFIQLSEIVCKEFGYTPDFEFLEGQPTGPHWRVGDNTKLKEFYYPRITIEEGVRKARRFLDGV